jgi:hypothetical protein
MENETIEKRKNKEVQAKRLLKPIFLLYKNLFTYQFYLGVFSLITGRVISVKNTTRII